MTLNRLWLELESRSVPPGPGTLVQSAHAGSTCAVQAGLRFPGGERVLLLRLPTAQARLLMEAGLTPAITMRLLTPGLPHPGQTVVELAAEEARHRDLFAHIGDDLVSRLRGDPARPAQALLDRLALWREFLRQHATGNMTEPRVRGLIGELWFLLHHVLPRTSPHRHVSAIAAWTGPLAAARDFNLGVAALDMKTGTPGSSRVEISSLHQLAPDPGTVLYLGHLILRRDDGGMSLPGAVDGVRAAVSPAAEELLEARLLAAGYLDAERTQHDSLRFTPGPFQVYTVAAGFPALTPTQVPAGIVAGQYTVDLAACQQFRMDPALIPGIGEEHRTSDEH